jgi:hypothetical protein
MFYHRSPALAPSVTAIQQHLGAVEQELEKIGHIARRRGVDAASAASEQIGDTISSVLGNMLERIGGGGQAVRNEAARRGPFGKHERRGHRQAWPQTPQLCAVVWRDGTSLPVISVIPRAPGFVFWS